MSAPKSVKLKQIDLKNFKSFRSASLPFPDGGLVALNARNVDTGGSSGSGKSNLNNAIAFALGFADAPATTLQSWDAEDPMQVVLTLGTDEGDVVIGKGHKNYLKTGNKTITGAKAIEEELHQIFGVDSDTLKSLVYRPQKTPGLFLSMDDANRKEFLGKVLGLDKYEDAIEKTKASIAEANVQLATSQKAFDTVKTMVDSYPVKTEPLLQELVLDEMRDKVVAAKELAQKYAEEAEQASATIQKFTSAYEQKSAALKQKHELVASELKAQIDSYWAGYEFVPDMTEIEACKAKLKAIEPRLVRAKEAYQTATSEYRTQSQSLTKSITQANLAASQLGKLNAKLAQLKEQIATLKGGVCYVCKRDGFYETHSLETLLNEETSLTAQIDEFSKAAGSIKGLEEKLASLEQPSMDMVNKLNAAQAGEQAKLAALNAALKTQEEQAKKDFAAGCEDLQTKLKLVKAEQQTALSELSTKFQTAVNGVKERKQAAELNSIQQKHLASTSEAEVTNMLTKHKESMRVFAGFAELSRQMETAEKNLTENKEKVVTETKLSEMLKGFIGSIFEEILNEVADETNRILATIPNVSSCSIEFKTEAVTQKGTVKQRITPLVSVNGHSAPIKSGCSGGMETAIELAVDIALSNVIARRTGASPQWLVLDEAFDGFDAPSKEACLELLQTHARDKLVLVVSHVAEFKEFFSSSIWVEYQNGTSRIVDA